MRVRVLAFGVRGSNSAFNLFRRTRLLCHRTPMTRELKIRYSKYVVIGVNSFAYAPCRPFMAFFRLINRGCIVGAFHRSFSPLTCSEIQGFVLLREIDFTDESDRRHQPLRSFASDPESISATHDNAP